MTKEFTPQEIGGLKEFTQTDLDIEPLPTSVEDKWRQSYQVGYDRGLKLYYNTCYDSYTYDTFVRDCEFRWFKDDKPFSPEFECLGDALEWIEEFLEDPA